MDFKKLQPHKEVLLLNQDFNPISIISWRRAIVLLLKEKVKFISSRVVKLISYVKIPYKKLLDARPSKNLIKKLGNYTCAYCGSISDLTIDHIIPLSKGGKHTFENTCCCCRTCNEKKGNRTPEQWGKFPKKQTYKPMSKLEITLKKANVDEWCDYVYF